MNRGPSRFAGACLRAFSPDAAVHPRTPIQPGPEVKSLDVESVSEFIWSADYRVHYVRIRLRDTSGGPFTIS